MASIVQQLEQELGLAPGGFAAAFGTEVRAIDAKIATVQAERDKSVMRFCSGTGAVYVWSGTVWSVIG